jgi:4-aminobutyrate aminotransferase-like enzyme
MTAVEFWSDAGGIAWGKALLQRRVVVSGTMIAATVVRVCPPLVITVEEIELALHAMAGAAADAAAEVSIIVKLPAARL